MKNGDHNWRLLPYDSLVMVATKSMAGGIEMMKVIS